MKTNLAKISNKPEDYHKIFNKPKIYYTHITSKELRRLSRYSGDTNSPTRPFKFLAKNLTYLINPEDIFRFISDPFKFSELFYFCRDKSLNKNVRNNNYKYILKQNNFCVNMAIKGIHIIDKRDEDYYEEAEYVEYSRK